MKTNLFKRVISCLTATALTASLFAVPSVAEEVTTETESYPYTLFAASTNEGAITVNASNFCVNGNVATNGTIVSSGNMNVNGTKAENAGEDMIYIFDKIDSTYFSSDSVETYSDDYTYEDVNININNPIDVAGELDLIGNINLNSGIKALEDVNLSGEVKNSNNAVICSKTGDINIETSNVSFNGLIYAPYGDIVIDSDNLNLNNVVVIGQTITINCPNVNANYSSSMAEFVGTESDADCEALEIFSFGSYNFDNNSIDIQWFSTLENGNYEVLYSDDNINYTSVAEVTDSTEYSYQIGEGFEQRYFKVAAVKNDGETIESIPFVVTKTNDGYSVDFLDSDGDRLADIYEEMLGTDLNNQDTDSDGLTDYQEVYITGTDPTKYDSVTEGVSDADADYDGDGLSNVYEIEIGTDPQNDDSDDDGLLDCDEINTYKTDPLKADTDEDGLSDYDELQIGLSPTNSETFGTPDAEYVSVQYIGADSEALTEINTEDNTYTLWIEYTGTGYAEGNAQIGISPYEQATKSEIDFGYISKISFNDSCNMSKATLNYRIKEEYTEFQSDNEELIGIKRFGVFKFNEEYNVLIPLHTEYDLDSDTLSAEIDCGGTYLLIDYEKWIDLWTSSNLTTALLKFPDMSLISCTMKTSQEIDSADVVFSVDISSGSGNNMGETAEENLERAKADIRAVAENTFENGKSIRFGVFGFTWYYSSNKIGYRTKLDNGSDWATNLEELDYLLDQLTIDYNYSGAYIECGMQDASSMISTGVKQYEYRDNADKYLFLYAPLSDLYCYSTGYYLSTLCSYQALYDSLEYDDIRLSYVIDKYSYLNIIMSGINQTGGTLAFYCDDTVSYNIFDFIYSTAEKSEKESTEYISSLTLTTFTLKEPLRYSIRSDSCDSDNDGLTDWRETDSESGIMKYNYEDGWIPTLPTYEECLNCALLDEDAKLIMEELRAKIGSSNYEIIRSKTVVPLTSNPCSEDSDGDGLLDGKAIYVGLKKVAPTDPQPLFPDIPKGIIERHIIEASDESSIPNNLDKWADLSIGQYRTIDSSAKM